MRFWNYVQKTDTCWIWSGANSQGYGVLRIDHVNIRASRISYYMHYNKDPGDLYVCHECENPKCVNPQDLFLGTNSENIKHAFQTGRHSHVGECHNQKIVNETIVERIRNLQGDYTYFEISKMFGISKNHVTDIMLRRSWSHI